VRAEISLLGWTSRCSPVTVTGEPSFPDIGMTFVICAPMWFGACGSLSERLNLAQLSEN
jgi:hypothetical protein